MGGGNVEKYYERRIEIMGRKREGFIYDSILF